MGEVKNISPYVFPGINSTHMEVLRMVCALYPHITPQQVLMQRRWRVLVEPRQVSIYILHTSKDYSLEKLAEIFGYKNHSGAWHSVRACERLMQTNKEFRNKILSIL